MSVRLSRLLLPVTVWGLLTITASGDECTLQLADNAAVTGYAAIVTQYRARQFTDAGERLRAVSEDRVEHVLVHFRTNDWSDDCIRAASMLHTEVGMASILREPPERYLDPAWELMTLLRDGDVRRRVQRDWLLLIALFHQRLMFDPNILGHTQTEVLNLGTDLYRGAQRYFDEAVKAFPRDPEILVAAGALFEWSGAPNFGEADHLAKAERLYERASLVDPNDPVAQLRYGVTLWKRGRSGPSLAPLRRVIELTDDDDLRFRWSYETGLSGRFGPLLESMRSEVVSR